jgi:ABC-type transport system involved in cytochrome c biogenesis permease subunit
MNRISVFCFVASYTLALALEVWHLWSGKLWTRVLAVLAGVAGVTAHTAFLVSRLPPLGWMLGWMLFVSWALAVFYVCGALHYRRQSWGLFVLPLILALVGMGVLFGAPPEDTRGLLSAEVGGGLWGPAHGLLLLLASIGLCVGFLASVMYLIQSHRLRTKAPPGEGLKLLSLERLEQMNRRALVVAFPLLTAGMLAGAILLANGSALHWWDARVMGTAMLWVVYAAVLYLRFARHARGRQMAVMTIVAFVLLMGCLTVPHARPAE